MSLLDLLDFDGKRIGAETTAAVIILLIILL